MKKSKRFMLALPALFMLILFTSAFRSFGAPPVKQEYYEIRIYHISDNNQENRMDAFLKDVYIPALHRAGILKVGVFKPVESDTSSGKLIYLFIPFRTADQYVKLPDMLANDKEYIKAGRSFIDAPYNDPPYIRHESIFMKAFADMPQPYFPQHKTAAAERIYELRSYESATEAKALKKIEMFNKGGEIALFESLDFNAVFYGEVLAGGSKPNLMYMTSFSDMKSHDEHWAAFRESPVWKKLSAMEEYKNTVSHINVHLLHPTGYSDF